MPSFRCCWASWRMAATLIVTCSFALVPAVAAPPATQEASADQRIQRVVNGLHKAFEALGPLVGGLSPAQQAKADALEKSAAAKLKADPAALEDDKTFAASTLAEFRAMLTPEQQAKYDIAMAANQKRIAQVRSGSNLKAIGMAAMVYSFDHDGAFPPDLGTLVPEAIEPRMVLSGDSKTTIPDDLSKKDAKQQAEWANQNADFVYLAGGKKMAAMPGGYVVAYVKPTTPPGGNNFLMADGSVFAFDAERSAKIVEELKAGKNPPPSMQDK